LCLYLTNDLNYLDQGVFRKAC